ncbi:hypothetical protein NKH57_29580 [Mesorhizobium sp. M1050]|uniref:hypothetical protein n=1 Tax=unclassified Mesorhizobium TaxID=325217 RepID=UPI00333DFB2E
MADHYRSGQMSAANAVRRMIASDETRHYLHKALDLKVEVHLPGAIGALLALLDQKGRDEPADPPD